MFNGTETNTYTDRVQVFKEEDDGVPYYSKPANDFNQTQ